MSRRGRMAAVASACIVLLLVVITLGLLIACRSRTAEEPIARSNYGWLKVEEVVLSGDGNISASGSTSAPARGHLYAVHLDFHTSISATTDFTLTQAAPALTILQLTNHYTDTWYYPAVQQTGSDGVGVGTYDQLLVNDQLTAAVGETISSTVIMTVTVYWGE